MSSTNILKVMYKNIGYIINVLFFDQNKLIY